MLEDLDVYPEVPKKYASAPSVDRLARQVFDKLSESRRREHLRAIEVAKKPETRARRIESS